MGIFSRIKIKRKAIPDDAAPQLDEKAVIDDRADSRIVTSEVALDVMADAIFRSTWPYGWFDGAVVDAESWTDEVVTGVTILSSDNAPRSCPANHPGFAAFEQAVLGLNARVAIKIKCKAVDVTMSAIMCVRSRCI